MYGRVKDPMHGPGPGANLGVTMGERAVENRVGALAAQRQKHSRGRLPGGEFLGAEIPDEPIGVE